MAGEARNSRRTKVVVTVDTEPSIAGAFANPDHTPLLQGPVAGEIDGRSEALGFLIETLCRHDLAATFFVETVHTRYFGDLAMGVYAEQLVRAGQDVQLHLHPNWLSFEGGNPVRPSAHRQLPRDVRRIPCRADRRRGRSHRGLDRKAGHRDADRQFFNRAVGLPGNAAGRVCGSRPRLCGGGAAAGARTDANRGRARDRRRSRTAGDLFRRYRPGRSRSLASCAGNRPGRAGDHGRSRCRSRLWKSGRRDRHASVRILEKARFPLCGTAAQPPGSAPVQTSMRIPGRERDRFEVLPVTAAAGSFDLPQSWTELRGNRFRPIVRAAENVINDHVRFL